MIVTRKEKVPWSWIWVSQLPFAFWMFAICLPGTAFTFSLRKFVDNPAVIATILSLTSLPVLIIAPIVNYSSDRIWTRWGRRKPFYIASNLFSAVTLVLMPVAPNLFSLTALYVLYYVGSGFGKTFFPLSQEIIPVSQRGRGSAIHTVMFQIGLLLYYSVMLGRFDDFYFDGPFTFFGPLTGEQVVYGLCALATFLPTLLIALGIKELPIPGAMPADLAAKEKEHPSFLQRIKTFFLEIFDRQWAILYLLLFGSAVYGLGLGSLSGLLYTEQWGYSKQDMGTNVAIGTLIMLPMAGIFGYVADRFEKWKIYLVALGSALVFNIAYYLFVMFVLPDHRPALWQIILFGELTAICGIFASTVQWPLIFEYIPRHKMGTASAGMEMMGALFGMILSPVVGGWVFAYSYFFHPHSGSEVAVFFQQPQTHEQVQAILQETNPQLAGQLQLTPHRPPGLSGTATPSWRLRLPDPEAEQLEKARSEAEQALARLESKSFLSLLPKDTNAQSHQAQQWRQIVENNRSALHQKAVDLREQLAALRPFLTSDDAALQAVNWQTVQLLLLEIDRRPHLAQLEHLSELWQAHPGFLLVRDLTATPVEKELAGSSDRPAATLGLFLADAAASTRLLPILEKTLRQEQMLVRSESPRRWEKSIPAFAVSLTVWPVCRDRAFREINRALARSSAGSMQLFRSSPNQPQQLRFLAAFPDGWPTLTAPSDPLPDAIRQRLQEVATTTDHPEQAFAAGQFLVNDLSSRLEAEGVVLPRAFMNAAYAPQKYDYFSAYLLSIVGGFFGIGILLLVRWCENKGWIRKLGVLESLQAQDSSASSSAGDLQQTDLAASSGPVPAKEVQP